MYIKLNPVFRDNDIKLALKKDDLETAFKSKGVNLGKQTQDSITILYPKIFVTYF